MRFIFSSRDRTTIKGREFRPLHSLGASLRLAPTSLSGKHPNHPIHHAPRLHIKGRQDGSKQSKPPSSA